MAPIVEAAPGYSGTAALPRYLTWTPSIAGALVAAAFSTILVAFGVAVGLGVASAAPTWRDASMALWLLSGLYLILVSLVSFGAGGYIAGRLSQNTHATDPGGVTHRDGMHGLAAWAIAVVLTVFIGALIAGAAGSRSSSPQNASTATAAEPLLSYELDRLFRPARRTPNAETALERAEAGRILLTTSSHSGVAAEDRTYLVQLVNAITGATGPDAERRVDTVIANAKTAIRRSRASGIIAAFSIAASLLLGALVAWFAAGEGGRQRNGEVPDWLSDRASVEQAPRPIP